MRFLKVAVLAAFLLVAAGVGWLAYFAYHPIEVAPNARTFNVEPGRSLRGVSQQFAQTGLVSDRWSFLIFARFMGAASEIKAGSYEVDAQLTPRQLLDKIVRGDFALAQIQFIEGWTFAQLREVMDAQPALKHDTLGLTSAQIIERLGLEKSSLEGQFFPDTYYFAVASSDLALLKQAYSRMQTKLEALWEQRVSGLPFKNAYEALIFASIIEKETGRHDERDLVSAVFINRLKRGMRLQTDPTVIYGMGASYEGSIHRRDLTTDTPYNTYTRDGLPPTPIALASGAALEAAVQPLDSTELYFVATGQGDGRHQFSRSLEEHNAAVARYLVHLRAGSSQGR